MIFTSNLASPKGPKGPKRTTARGREPGFEEDVQNDLKRTSTLDDAPKVPLGTS